MKKIFIILLSIMMIVLIQVRVGAVITQFEYDLTFTEGVTFNLETGTYGEDDDYSSTTRIRIFYNSLWIRNFTVGLDLEAHHILFWTDTNEYIGYQNLVESTYEGSKFLGNASLPEITIPTKAAKFSIVARHTDEDTELIPHDLELDTPIAELNNHTLEEVFEDGNLFDGFEQGNAISTTMLRIRTTFINVDINEKIYIKTNNYSLYNIQPGLVNDEVLAYPATEPIIYDTGWLSDDLDLIFNIVTTGSIIINHRYADDSTLTVAMAEDIFHIIINLTYLGIDHLTKAQMDYWYNVYVRVKEKTDISYDDFFTAVDITPTNESAVTTVNFGLTDPFWYYSDLIGTTEKWIYYDYASDGTGTDEVMVVQFDTDFSTFKSYSTLSPISGSDYYIQTAETDGAITWWLDSYDYSSRFTNIYLISTIPFANTFSPDGLTSYNLTSSPEEVIKEWYDLDFEYLTEAKLLASTYDYIAANYNDWEAEYEILKEYNAISFVNFETTFAFYLRDVVEAEELDLNERIDEWLMDVGLDSTFSKIVIVVVLMAIFAIILALVHAPAILIMIVEAFIVIIFTALGFIPLWMDVVIALLFGGLLYLKLTNGSGGEEE